MMTLILAVQMKFSQMMSVKIFYTALDRLQLHAKDRMSSVLK